MVAQPFFWSTLLLIAACTATGCASAPALPREIEIIRGRATHVALYRVDNKLSLSLLNRSAIGDDTPYDQRSTDVGRKVIADDELQVLLDVLAQQGMFKLASSIPAPDALDLLIVEHGGKRWIWSRRLRGAQVAEEPFHTARNYFLAVYNSVIAYHGTDDDRRDLEDQERRLRNEARGTRRRLRELESEPPRQPR